MPALPARTAGAGAAVLLLVGGCGADATAEPATQIHIAAASDLQFALDEVIRVAEQDRADDLSVSVTYGSSGTFVQQIANGAPVDLYLSADQDYAEQLIEDGHADEDSLFRYAVGRMVVWAPEDSPADPDQGLAGLTAESVDTVALANPEHAPYGAAAVAALEDAGVYEDVSDKLVRGENIAQAAEFVRSGNADVGVLALSLARAPEMRDEGSYAEVPLESFPRLNQAGVVLAEAPAEAEELASYLQSSDGQAILADYGFYPPEWDGD
ncbi:molybdate ABC transporter substrate-binding protein [Lipingzhangella sp. LS1_29]|uniref:Molybdate ABC transporter substrate-binding protein n=1 Tax=Lipingzhangella rawalii TaxID=2055835 RepID=A0ABU2H547_9ACTN|nr:molybdate ABC transporter substrate-binding protein [Lipingzhangella rawalii]MDS1270122.1 molybdate ABC transporter substrate-binding protein [Lipingzhangella rawalii]